MKSFEIIDKFPQDTIRGIQGELLTQTIRHAYENSPYYRKRFDDISLLPSQIKGVEDLERLPLTGRDDFQKDNNEFLAAKMEDIVEIVSTTGTTGEPVFVALTYNDMERLACNEERNFSNVGAHRGDLFHIAVTCDNLFIAGIAYYRGLIRLGATAIRIGPQNIARHLELMKKLMPTGIVAVPSFVVHMSRRIGDNGMSPAELGLKKIVLIGDSIRDMDFKSNALGSLIESAFGDICYSTYGITEAQVAFSECSLKQGLHSHPDFVIVEIIDDNGNKLPDGEIGELILTPLQLEGMPLIRYKTGDITFKVSSPCPCGRNSVRIGPIIGRKQHKLKVKGVTLYPKTLENAIIGIKAVINYQIEAYTGDDQTDHLILRVGSHRKDSDFRTFLYDIIRAKARITPEIEIEHPESVEERLFEGGNRKPIIFKDRRNKVYG
ncbi:MAG: AMP-binding protein [Nitrospirae bacterium]|nr:AMP-binding protein [Nitrospirota bacterium]